MRPTATFLHGASVHQVDVPQFLCFAPAQDGPRNRRIIVEQPVLCTIEALDEHAIVGVSQGQLEVGDVSHEGAAKREIPLMQFKRLLVIASANIKIGGEPRRR